MNKSSYTYKDSCLAFLFSLVAFLATSVIFSFIVSSIAASSGQTPSDVLSTPLASIVSSLLSELAFFVTFIIYTKANKKKYFVDSALDGKYSVGLGSIIALFSIAIVLCSLNFTGMCNTFFETFAKPNTSAINMPLDTVPQLLLGIILLAVLPAICEELIFRGIILNGFFSKFKPAVAILITSGLFALIHMSIYSTVHQFILGIELGLILYLTGRLGYCMIFHFFNNLFVVVANFIFKDNFPLEIKSFGGKEIVISLGAFAVGALLTWLFVKFLAKRKIKNAQDDSACDEESANNSDTQSVGLSQRVSDKTATIMLAVSTLFCLLLWVTSSFGG